MRSGRGSRRGLLLGFLAVIGLPLMAEVKLPQPATAAVVTGKTLGAGFEQSCAIRVDQTVACWGSNGAGQLGDGTTTNRLTPTTVVGLTGVAQIAAGLFHSCAVRVDQTVACWGSNFDGQLGDGTTTNRLTATTVVGLVGVTQIAPGQYYSCAVRVDQTVACWGSNAWGQLGDGTTTSRLTPTTVVGLTGVTQIATGYYHSCAVRVDQTGACWGSNGAGQLGDGTTTNRLTPTTVVGLVGVTQIATGYYHSCAVRVDQTAACWGDNLHGQLGDGTTTSRLLPTAVVGLAGVTQIANGFYHTCAVRVDQAAACWGYNWAGQLGDGTTTNSLTATTVVGLVGVTQIATGHSHSCAVRGDQTVACWGLNSSGQIGDGRTSNLLVPKTVTGLSRPICPAGSPTAGQVRRNGDTNCDGKVRVAIVGDSYISGEGAGGPYRIGTDDHDTLGSLTGTPKNLCHRSERSWAVQAAKQLTGSSVVYDFIAPPPSPLPNDFTMFTACSGAVSDNVDGKSTSSSDGKSVVHYATEGVTQLAQLALAAPSTIDVVFVSIGGNDAQFADVIATCLASKCATQDNGSNLWTKAKLDHVADFVGNRAAEVVSTLRTTVPNAEIYWAGYPNPLLPNPSDCGSVTAAGTIAVAASAALAAKFPLLGAAGTKYIVASGDLKIDSNERRWISSTFVPALNARLRSAAQLDGVHFVDMENVFANHPICAQSPNVAWANGLTFGNDAGPYGGKGLSVVGNESFHPTPVGYDNLLTRALTTYGPTFGTKPNGPAPNLTAYNDPNVLQISVIGPDPNSDVFVASGSAYVVIRNAPANEVIVVAKYSLGTVSGRVVTDAQGNATVPIELAASTPPGLHHFEVYTESGARLGSVAVPVLGDPSCQGLPDIDGDNLKDSCDLDPTDGPLADFDHDTVANGIDNCPLLANTGQADTDNDSEGDTCDPDFGLSRLGTQLKAASLTGSGAYFTSLTPARILDTRSAVGAPVGAVGAGSTLTLQVTGRGGVPVGASAVVMNVTVTGPKGDGYVTVFPCDSVLPNVSNLNFSVGQTVPNLVAVRLDGQGRVCVNTVAETHLIAGVSGYNS